MEAIVKIDADILLWIQENLRNDILTPVVKGITHLGDAGIFWILLLVVLLMIPKTRKAGILGAAALILTFLVTNVLLKPMVARVRPYEVIEGLTRLIGKQSDRSFPSGHTANSMAVGVLLWMISQKSGESGDNSLYFPKKAGWLLLTLSILISLSRLYVGVHYPTDVLGGAVIAVLDAWIVYRGAKCFLAGTDGR